MKFSTQFLVLGLLGASFFFMSNSGGRASATNEGNTGAPGDAQSTCVTCHNASAALSTLTTISLLDANNEVVTTYLPGETYTIQVKMTTSGNAAGHGFQLIPLKDSDNTDVKGMSDAGNMNNYKIKTITNGRTYAEHDDISSSNVFDVTWTAPAAGTGAVSFYAGGNSVNGNGTSAGDGADVDKLTVSEGSSSSVNDLESNQAGTLGLFPNPVERDLNIRYIAAASKSYTMKVVSLEGKVVLTSHQNLQKGENRLVLPASDLSAGAYLLVVQDGLGQGVVRFVKM